ncbi:hypothetical protein E4U24_002697 [Claviceps purpurea]|nr:hypothetical protein E4U24_002697 [Claviceps purpurea]
MATSTKKPSHAGNATVIHSAPRKFKASDLPLPSATRAAIESLAHSFKKGGAYDSVRKQVWDKFAASDYEAQVTKAILEVAEKEVERNPLQLLTLDRRKAAALIDGALERSGVYQKAEDVIGQLIDLDAIEEQIREIRRAEIGEEAAEAERVRGSKSDEAYAADIAARQAERERLREEIRLKEAAIEEEKRRIAREEHKKEEREREQAEMRRQEERDERRKKREQERAERERLRDEERDRRYKEREVWNKEREQRGQSGDKERDRDGPRDRDRERDRSRDRTRDRARDKDHGKGQPRDGSRARDRDTKPKPTVPDRTLSKEDHDRLEQEALADLLRESSRTDSAKPELEVDEALAPPPRKTAPASAIDPIRRETRKANDSSSKNERRESKTPADPKISSLRDEPKPPTRSASRAGDGGRDKDREGGIDRDKDPDAHGRRNETAEADHATAPGATGAAPAYDEIDPARALDTDETTDETIHAHIPAPTQAVLTIARTRAPNHPPVASELDLAPLAPTKARPARDAPALAPEIAAAGSATDTNRANETRARAPRPPETPPPYERSLRP